MSVFGSVIQTRLPENNTWESLLRRRQVSAETIERIGAKLDQSAAVAEAKGHPEHAVLFSEAKTKWKKAHSEMERGFQGFFPDSMKGTIHPEDLCVIAQSIEPFLHAIEEAGATLG